MELTDGYRPAIRDRHQRPAPGAATAERAPSEPSGRHRASVGRQAPLASPALEQAPRLASVLERLAAADRSYVQAVVELVPLVADGAVDEVARVRLEDWVGIVAGQTRMDRRLLLRLCRRLARYPRLVAAAAQGRVSFAQLRGIWLAIRDVDRGLDPVIDARIGAVCEQLDATADPDALVDQVEQAIAEAAPQRTDGRERAAVRSRFLYLQPTLDGTGGRVSGSFDAAGLAVLDEATAPHAGQRSDPRGVGRIRADNLLERLTHVCAPDGGRDGRHRGGPGDGGSEGSGHGEEGLGLTDDEQELLAGHVPLTRDDGALPVPRLLLRWDLDALLDRDRTPATLLTRLVGGRLRLSTDAARRLIDGRGAELRSVVVDDTGTVVGVGRGARVPPGWLRDATLAVHDTCAAPGCDRPARSAQLDHAVPWWPATPGEPYGTTDIDNLGPLCGATNREKESGGWRAVQTADGLRRWRHPATGLRVTTVPATWRPRGTDPPPTDPSGPDPSGPDPSGPDPPADDTPGADEGEPLPF